jgi:hypothetical protein
MGYLVKEQSFSLSATNNNLTNVEMWFYALPDGKANGAINVSGNTLTFDRSLGSSYAIVAGGSPDGGTTIIDNNNITSSVAQPSGYGIYVNLNDVNGVDVTEILNNTIGAAFSNPIVYYGNSPTRSNVFPCTISGNIIAGPAKDFSPAGRDNQEGTQTVLHVSGSPLPPPT